ncbi:MAG: SsrA-binding protein SmpB [Bacillota bacterium]
MKASKERLVADNRKARHDYHVDEVIEAGLVLTGAEVKSLRAGRANLRDGYAVVEGGQVFLHNVHISPYDKAPTDEQDPLRVRKLLLHKAEIRRLAGKVREKGYTLVPLRLYFGSSGKAKVEVALAKGKRLYDKRQDMQERDDRRKMERALKGK